MNQYTLDEFTENAQELIAQVAIGEEPFRVTVPGAAAAVVISEQEYFTLTNR